MKYNKEYSILGRGSKIVGRGSKVVNRAPLFQRVRMYNGVDRVNIMGKFTVYAWILDTLAVCALGFIGWLMMIVALSI
jgi:hypothetical protein